MDGSTANIPCLSPTLNHRLIGEAKTMMKKKQKNEGWSLVRIPTFLKRKLGEYLGVVRYHYPLWCTLAAALLMVSMRLKLEDVLELIKEYSLSWIMYSLAACLVLVMFLEYTLVMVQSNSPPYDLGFIATRPLHRLLASRPALNSFLAGLNTAFLGLQILYLLWTVYIEDRPRATMAMLLMLIVRGFLGYTTRLPLPQEYLSSGMDYPVANVSFFLFYSGHVGLLAIAALDQRRMQRMGLAWTSEVFNVFQVLRLLTTRGHYTMDLVAGFGAGFLFDYLAGTFLQQWKVVDAVGKVVGRSVFWN